MQPAVLSLHIRWQIVEKTLEGLTTRQIAKHLGISKTSVGRVCQYYRKFGHVEIISLGRPRIFNSNDLKYLEVLLKERVDWYLYELQSEMELWMGKSLSISTLWRALHRLGYTHKKVYKFYTFISEYFFQ
ncbi:unnamed protein product [Rhizophagus irregularis]|uniref:Transposase n=1 Tax=Rhizophagus irregularis TaxID=588596 RepID=A0A915ZBS2_9GLOM|nr:unnamed protein product [Rhizophagus irregularis]